MRTNTVLDDKLAERVQKITRIKTKREGEEHPLLTILGRLFLAHVLSQNTKALQQFYSTGNIHR